jgi:hypothetical protein
MKPKKETRCFLHVEGLTNTKPCKLKANVKDGKTNVVQFYGEASIQGFDQACGQESSTHKNDPCKT